MVADHQSGEHPGPVMMAETLAIPGRAKGDRPPRGPMPWLLLVTARKLKWCYLPDLLRRRA